jgi:hypothetical protein
MMTPGLHEIEAQVLEAMSRAGIEPRETLVFDGKLRRARINRDRGLEKSLAYQVFADEHPAGWFQDWHSGEQISWRFKPDGGSPLAGVTNYHPSSLERAEAEAIRQKENAEKLERAWSAYQSAKPIEESDEHGYLLVKHVAPRGGFPFGGQWCGLRTGSMASASGRVMDNLLLIPFF